MSMYSERSNAVDKMSYLFEWDKWKKEIPYLDFDKKWLVRAIPAFHTGVIRYNIIHKNIPNSHVSIYLDCYDRAGSVGEPYWEIYPYEDDCFRCLLYETDALLLAIKESFKQQKKEL